MKEDYQKNNELTNQVEENILKLKKEYSFLLAQLALFASNGDLSENADWQSINEKKEMLSKEIIKKEIQLAEIKNKQFKKEQQVEYLILKTREKKLFLLTANRSEPAEGVISSESLLGSILQKGEIGETLWVHTEELSYEIKILEKKWIIQKFQ